ncbi:hypothetical protein HPB50_021015 [Hyalomma asiaticum]|uniref:Uncharacterized protein n=1 Tax=Hyalomma asiaticum TaxID=266040 RepID=A0ACB7SPS7_HYAAI|nr:hypothetical protein HPB50_021015 [Hyalomma asiaticum]
MAFKSSTCTTDFCKKYSALLESSVDDSVEACQDFYQHVCGLWEKTHTSDKSVMEQAWNDYIDFVMSKLSDAKDLRSSQRGECEESGRSWKSVIFVIVIVTAAMVITGSLLLWRLKPHRHKPMAFKSLTCTTDFCKKYSALLESSVDDSVEACQDFYQYVCGLWDKTHTSDKSVMEQAWNDYIDFVMSKLSDAKLRPGNADVEGKARLYLKACLKVINESNVPNVKRMLAEGGVVWPEKNPKPDFLKALLFMSRYVFMPVLLHLSYDTGSDGRLGPLHWLVRKDYWETARILRTLGKTKHIRDHLRMSYEEFSKPVNDTRLDEIMDHVSVYLSFEANFADVNLTSVTFNDSTKFLEYAPSVPKQR